VSIWEGILGILVVLFILSGFWFSHGGYQAQEESEKEYEEERNSTHNVQDPPP
jgi:hypothetical protein